MLPQLEDIVLFLIIQNFMTLYYHIKDKMPARSDQKKTQVGSQQESSSGPGQVLWPAQSPAAACLSVHRPHS